MIEESTTPEIVSGEILVHEQVRRNFYDWLRTEKNLAENTCNSYLSSLHLAEQFCYKEAMIPLLFHEIDHSNERNIFFEQVFQNPLFKEFSRQKQNRLKPVLGQYQEFLNNGTQIFSDHNNVGFQVSEDLREKIVQVLDQSFSSGIHGGSFIAQDKLRLEFEQLFSGEKIPEELDLGRFIALNGVKFQNVFYVIPEKDKKTLVAHIEEQIQIGYRLFYYESIYEIHKDMLNEIHIYSSDVLKLQLQQFFPQHFFYAGFFCVEKSGRIEQELKKCFLMELVLSVDDIQKSLKYVPQQVISQSLARLPEFIRVENGVYTHLQKIRFHSYDGKIYQDFISGELEKENFCSLLNLSVDKELEHNPELSDSAIREGIYQIFLKDIYVKHGNILMKEGDSLNVEGIFKDFCLTNETLTETQLQDFEEEITTRRGTRSIAVAYESMIRVSSEKFQSKDSITFPVDKIDEALSVFVGNRLTSLQSVDSFTAFPYVEGTTWNLYLLESFCLHYSKKFQLLWAGVNSKNIAVICPKDRTFQDYNHVLAEVVIFAKIPLLEDKVGDYLSQNKFLARRTTTAIHEIITKAQEINQGG